MKNTKKLIFYLLLSIAALFFITNPSLSQETAGQLFEKALYLEEATGELEQAIDLFQQILEEFPDNREFAAKSLLHLGICYEKQGLKQARGTYQDVINRYPDQHGEVAMAKERLNRLLALQDVPHKPSFRKIRIPSELSQNAATSPDGQQLLLVYDEKLWTMPLSGNLGSDIPGIPIQLNTDGVKVTWAGLSWSGDGKTIAFNEIKDISSQDIPEKKNKNQIIYILSAKGGKPERIVENYCGPRAVSFRMSLSPDGKTLAYSSVNDDEMNIFSIPVEGGMPRKLVESPAREPVFSPNGKMIAYVEDKALGRRGGGLWTVPASGGNPIFIAEAGNASSPVWSPDASKIAFLDDHENNKIIIVPVSEDGKPAGKKTAINAPEGTDAIQLLTGWDKNNKIGIIIYRVKYALFTLPAEGGQAVLVYRGDASQPRWTPDGKHILFRKAAGQKAEGWPNHKLTVIPADGGKERNILTGHQDKIGLMPYGIGNKLSPNGEDIVISAKKTDDDTVYIGHHPTRQIWRTSISGKKLAKITNPSVPYSDDCPCWSPDGRSIAFVRTKLKEDRGDLWGEMGIYMVNTSGGAPQLLTLEPEKFIYAINWSPDGKWIAYLKGDKHSSDESSTLNIINVDNGISRVVGEVSNFTVHTELAWSPDSKRIAFNDREGKVIKVMSLSDGSIEDIETGLVDVEVFHLDWSTDGKRFVFVGFQGGVPEYWVMEDFLPLEKLPQKKEKERFVIHKVLDGTEAGFDGGNPSPDGKYFAFTDWSTGNLAIYESVTGKKRFLTKQGSWESDHVQYVENSTWSPDGKQIVYDWYNEKGFIELRLIGLDDSKPRVLYKPNEEVIWVQTFDWSADGKQILACFQRKDDTRQIVLVSAGDGSLRVLKILVGKNWSNNMSFSPDGRYIVYDYPTEEYTQNRDIYLMSTNGDHEISLIEHPAYDKVLGWAPDGKNILFASDRTGTFAAFVIQVAEGKPQGAPKLIKSDIGNLSPRGFTQKGSFYYSTSKEGNNVYTADLDPETGKILAPPKKAIKRFEGSNYFPYYSPDGKYLAYISVRNRQSIICIHNLETGEDREFYLNQYNINRARSFRWSPDCNSILAMGRDNKNRFGIFRINVQTGNITLVIPWESWKSTFIHSCEWSRDGKAVFYVAFNTTNDWSVNNLSQIMVRDLDTGTEKELYRFDNYINISLSPDGKWLASSHPLSLKVMPVAGGEPRELYRFKEEYKNERPITWSIDGKYILFSKKEPGQDRWDLCRIPAEGGEPQRLGLEMENGFMNLSAHLNGRNIAFSSTEQTNAEFWVMENFLPELKAEQ